MSKNRLEAFRDGVLAVIITMMVLETKPPQGATLAALRPVTSIFLTFHAAREAHFCASCGPLLQSDEWH